MRSAIAIAFCWIASWASAEPFAVHPGLEAKAYSFKVDGTCYALFANHITQRGSFPIVTSEPTRTGTVDILHHMRQPELDLGLGVVTGAAESRCEPTFRTVRRDDSRLLLRNAPADLVIVRASGRIDRRPVRIKAVDYSHVEYRALEQSDDESLGKGITGAVLVIGETPVAMQIEREGGEEGTFRALRIDAALGWFARYLERPFAPERSLITANRGDIPYEIVSWSANGIDGEADARSLLSSERGPYIVAPNALPLQIDVLLPEGSDKLAVVQLESTPDDFNTQPKLVRLLVQRGPGRNLIEFNSGTGTTDGITQIGVNNQRFIAARIVILDSWNAARPIRLDRLRLLGRE